MNAPEQTSGVPRLQEDQKGWKWALSAAITLVVFLPLAGLGFGFAFLRNRDTKSASAVSTGSKAVQVEMREFSFKPSSIPVAAGQKVQLTLIDKGTVAHDLKIDGANAASKLLKPGGAQTLTVGPFDKSLTFSCTVPGHKEAGMVGTFALEGAAAPAAVAATSATASTPKVDFSAEPAKEFKSRDPVLAPAPAGTLHEIEMRATERVLEVAPGVKQEMWTFGDTVPGPTLRGKIGDTFRVTLVNDGKVGHSIDFHASEVAWNDKMRTIQPGEKLVYEFKAEHAGIYMYHCGTPPALHHIGNGMYGAVVVDPPGLAAVDREFFLVQSELYVNPSGGVGDLTAMLNDKWDAVVFNGYVNQYRYRPINVKTGEKIRVWVMDTGPSENSSFHVVGTVFDTVFKEGNYTLKEGQGSPYGGAQALDLQPAQGGFVEFDFNEDGLYPIVTHKFSNVAKGALGLFQSGEVAAAGAGGH